MQNAIYQVAIGFGLVLYVAASPCPFPIMAANAEPVASNRLIDKLLVTRLTWHREGPRFLALHRLRLLRSSAQQFQSLLVRFTDR